MKVIVTESKIGIEYLSNVISTCDQNGIECIVDDKNGDIYYYDPKGGKYGDDKLLYNNDVSIWDIVEDKELFNATLFDASGAIFKDFAVKWNELQKKGEDEEVYKTKVCRPIRGNFTESMDNPNDWSASEGEVEIMWTVDYSDFGIEAGNTESFVVEYDDVAPDNDYDIEDNGLRDEICRLIGKEYPDLDFEPYDFDILNEREFWGVREQNRAYPYDESGIETDVVEGIPVWASSYLSDGDDSALTGDDKKEVDAFVDKLNGQGLRLIAPIEGTYNEFNSSPAFGLGCDTEDWSCEVDGKYMNESESTGRTIDVTLSFTHGHYGKELKSGDERTIKVDLSKIPEIYDEDDLMSWLADVATEQIPGKGSFTKYDFEIENLDSLIKAVKGDEGFGPDVDIDMDNFGPDSIPDNVSYGDAMKIYRKMRDAYDDRNLQYKDFDAARNKLMDSVVKGLLKEKSLDELADEWFIDYGSANGWGWKTAFKYNVANKLHEIHKKKYPDQHKPVPQREHWRGWSEDNCSCGFCSSSDSSD